MSRCNRYIYGVVKMRTSIVLCLLVSIAFATNLNHESSEYEYHVEGRTLTGLHEVANQFSGVLYAAKLKIQPKSQEKWLAKVYDVKFGRVNTDFPKGWTSYIPESLISWKSLEIDTQCFEVVLQSGVITDLIVNKDVQNWQANMIKGIMSQFQLDIKASEHISSQLNVFSKDQTRPSAIFKTMEETITGNTETLYEIHPVPEYTMNSVYPHLKHQEGQNAFEVIKHKNYTNSKELPLYSFGFGDGEWEPATNQMGTFFTRSTFSRALLTGNTDRHIIQNSSTINKIIVNPTLMDQQKGMVVSSIKLSLKSISAQTEPFDEVSQPQPLGNLVYTYDIPNSGEVREKVRDHNRPTFGRDFEPEKHEIENMLRRRMRGAMFESPDKLHHSGEQYTNEQPKINEAPGLTLLPFSVGCKGNPVKKCIDIIKIIKELALDIGTDLQDSVRIRETDTLNKFTMLASLIRTLSTEELQKVARSLYTQSSEDSKVAAWKAFRDAVAESGTGPALAVIESWILSGKIQDDEASQVVSTMSRAVRQPTLAYMEKFLELIKSPVVQSQWPLNNTAIISFGDLIRRSIIDEEYSKRAYPVKSFGKFSTKESRRFVNEKVIPYFTNRLENAISGAETQKIHVYIAGLGNIGHPKCLEAFEPYLEGRKKVSGFQRLLMVASMDRLAESYPKLAQSILFKIYQNTEEIQEVRIAALVALMRTSPPTDMLILIASNTRADRHEHVNAAVKSLIEEAAQLIDVKWTRVRQAAIAAKPLLNKKTYGNQHTKGYVLQYVYNTLNTMYKDKCYMVGSEDSLIPRAFRFTHRESMNGISHRLNYWQGGVNSIEELWHVCAEQTASFKNMFKRQEEQASQQGKNPWSSQYIARLLNMRDDEMEQLEGHLYMEDGVPTRMFGFDNRTIEELPEFLRGIEEKMRKGQDHRYVKFTNNKERAISFPTEMGFPFLYTYDTPKLIRVEGKSKATSSPKISENGELHKPEKIEANMDITVGVHSKIQGRLSFYTPFDHQQYISGYDKLLNIEMPVNGDIEVDVKHMQLKAEFKIKESENGASLVRYDTRPYTSLVDIMNFQPLTTHSNTKTIKSSNMRSYDRIFGTKMTGIAFRVKMQHEREFINTPWLLDLARKGRIPDMLSSLWNIGSIQTSIISLSIDPQQTSTNKIKIGLGYKNKYSVNPEPNNSIGYKQFSEANDPMARESVVIEKVSAGIKNVEAAAYDAFIQFRGEKNIEYIATGGLGRSNVDPKSRLAIYYKKISNSQEVKPYEALFVSYNEIPNTNGLDPEYSLQSEPNIQTTWHLHFGQTEEPLTKIKTVMHFNRSEERKEYLMKLPNFLQCQREMREGNKQLEACANLTTESDYLDNVHTHIIYENVNEDLQQNIRDAYDVLRLNYFMNIEDSKQHKSTKEDEIIVRARFDNDLRSANVSMKWQDVNSTIRNVPINGLVKEVLVQHPVLPFRTRLMSWVMGINTYRPICVVDKTQARTFNNRTYPIEMSNYWTVMLQYIPKEPRRGDRMMSVEEQLKSQINNYVVLVRANSENKKQKEVKLTFSTEETEFKVVDITMSPKQDSSESKVKVTVNGETIIVTDEKSYDVNGDHIQIYALPNGEVKLRVRAEFDILYDGERIRLVVINGHYRNSVRGVCGLLGDDPTKDLLTSQNCIARDPMQFWKSYEVEGQEGQDIRTKFAGNTPECSPIAGPIYRNVISDLDVGRKEDTEKSSVKCSYFQTRYLEENGQICFTTRAVSACHRSCRSDGVLTKNVPMHCIPKSNVAQLWKNQIDNGHSPDFSQKKVIKTVAMDLPKTCSK